MSPGWEVSFTPLLVGWHLAVRVFPLGITQDSRLKPPGPDLMGGISPCLVLWRGACHGWLSPVNGDPGCTQILTRHCGARSQIISQLVNSGTTPTRHAPVVQPLRVIETPEDGVGAHAAPLSDNPDGTVGLH
jgi:hypothetical protein